MRAASFAFQTLEAARDLAILLANACPDPQRVVVGLTELLLNAVEHGNLGITYREKGELCEEERWEQEVASRLAHPLNADKEVQVRFTRGPEEIRLVIRDQGDGFDWQAFLEMDPARANDSHGRGIAMARLLSFDSLEYRGCGNEVEVTVEARRPDSLHGTAPGEWALAHRMPTAWICRDSPGGVRTSEHRPRSACR